MAIRRKPEPEITSIPQAPEAHPLQAVFDQVIDQVTNGKGMRHQGRGHAVGLDFMNQPWVHYERMHGRGFLTGQAAKKLEEAASRLSGSAFKAELLGAIAYAAMAVLAEPDDKI